MWKRGWAKPLSGLLGGQAIVQIVNFSTALLLIRLLPVEQYAIYTLANALLALASTGSDLNLSTALTTYGARVKGDRKRLSSLVAATTFLRRQLYIVVSGLVVLAAPLFLAQHHWQIAFIGVLALVLLLAWYQQGVTL